MEANETTLTPEAFNAALASLASPSLQASLAIGAGAMAAAFIVWGAWRVLRKTDAIGGLVIALAALTVGLNASGQYLDGAAADPVTRWSMVIALAAIGIGGVVFAHILPKVRAHGAWSLPALITLALVLTAGVVSASRTNIALSAIIAANTQAGEASEGKAGQRAAAIEAAREARNAAQGVVDGLPDLSPMLTNVNALTVALADAEAAVRDEARRGHCGPICGDRKDERDAARIALQDAQAAYEKAAAPQDEARKTLKETQDALTAAIAAPIVTKGAGAMIAAGQPAWLTEAMKWAIVSWLELAVAFGPSIAALARLRPSPRPRREARRDRTLARTLNRPKSSVSPSVVLETSVETADAEAVDAADVDAGAGRRRPITAREGETIIRMRADGASFGAIGAKLGRSKSTVSTWHAKNSGPRIVKATG